MHSGSNACHIKKKFSHTVTVSREDYRAVTEEPYSGTENAYRVAVLNTERDMPNRYAF